MDKGETSSSSLPPHHLWKAGELALESSEQKSCPCPSLIATLRRADPILHLSSTVPLAVDVGVVGDPAFEGVSMGEPALPLVCRKVAWSSKRPSSPLSFHIWQVEEFSLES